MKQTIITILFVLGGDLLHPRQVRLGECNYDYIEVISGLESGEQVIVSGHDEVQRKGETEGGIENKRLFFSTFACFSCIL